MVFNFRESATKSVVDSALRNGREKAMLDVLAKAYPNGLTVIAGDLTHAIDKDGNPKEYCLIVFAEELDKYVNGGSAFTKIVRGWLAEFDGDVDKMNEELKASGGVKVKVDSKRLDNGNNYTVVTVL